jgi:hypothetical protein
MLEARHMKKIIISIIVAAATSMAAFGEGYITFLDSAVPVLYNGVPTGGLNVGFIWAPGSNQTLSGLTSTPDDWSILTALPGSWQWAVNATTLNNVVTTTWSDPPAPPPAVGTFNGGVLSILNSSPYEAISMYIVAWQGDANYAKAADAYDWVIESSEINWTLGRDIDPGLNLNGAITFVPEPSTLALAGLGGLSLLLFRRRK